MSESSSIPPPDAARAKRAFIDAFRAAWEERCSTFRPGELHALYETKDPWTRCMLGPCDDGLVQPVLRDTLLRYARWRGYEKDAETRIVPQRLTFDLTLAGGNTYLRESRSPFWWPKRFEVLLEHENVPGSIYEELWKLLMTRSDLAVLIGYLPDDWDLQFLNDALKMVRTTSAADPAVRPERVLFIFGERDPAGLPVVWTTIDFDTTGLPTRDRTAIDQVDVVKPISDVG